jgi:hypothetical protein
MVSSQLLRSTSLKLCFYSVIKQPQTVHDSFNEFSSKSLPMDMHKQGCEVNAELGLLFMHLSSDLI